MKKLFTLIIVLISLTARSQVATQKYVDSSIKAFNNTLDSVVVKAWKATTANNLTISLDTLTIPINTVYTVSVHVITDSDVTEKWVTIKNTNGVYSIIDDRDNSPFAHNRSKSLFNSTILYQISSTISNNKVIILAKGQSNKTMNWKCSHQTL